MRILSLSLLLVAHSTRYTLGFMIRPIDRLHHLRARSRDGSFGSVVDLALAESSSSLLDDELCPVEPLAENAMTSTFAEGTPESDIILTWEPELAEEIKESLAERSAGDKPYMIAVIGNPGSGKTTSCFSLSDLIGDCFVLPFDGYHLSMAELEKLPNAEDLIYRRGAPDTFDPARLHKDLHRIRDGEEAIIKIPGFDHSLGDPEPDAHEFVRSQHKVVLCEGLYLLHDDERWGELKKTFDMSIFVEANIDVCVERLKIRNQCIPGYTEEEIIARVDSVDRVNAETVEKSKQYATKCVESAAQRSMTTTIADGTPETDIEVSWEKAFAAKIRKDLETRSADRPYMVSIVGGPGSGKVCKFTINALSIFVVMIRSPELTRPSFFLRPHPVQSCSIFSKIWAA
jgi:pantothenate kinase